MAEAKQATGVSIVDPKVNTIRNVLMRGIDQLKLVMAKEMSAERMVRIAVNAASRNPTLAKCTPQSIGLALLTGSQFGLEPNGRDAHLVPFWNSNAGVYEATFMPDYKGLIKLAYRSGKVQMFDAKAVREHDMFDYEYGSKQFLKHKPAMSDRGKLIAAWALVHVGDAETFVVLDAEAVMKRKNASQTGRKDTGPWKDWEDEMWAKTAVKSLAKLVPLGDEFERAIDADDAGETGQRQLDVTLNLPSEPLPEAKPGPEPGTSGETQGDGNGAAQTAPAGSTQQSKSDQLAEQIRQRGQQQNATTNTAATTTAKPAAAAAAAASKQSAAKKEPAKTTAARPAAETKPPQESVDLLPAHPCEFLKDETPDAWTERMKVFVAEQQDEVGLDMAERDMMQFGADHIAPGHISALDAAIAQKRATFSPPAQTKEAPFDDQPQDQGGPPTAEESAANFRSVYQQLKDAKSLDEMTAVMNMPPEIMAKLSGNDMAMLEKVYDRESKRFTK